MLVGKYQCMYVVGIPTDREEGIDYIKLIMIESKLNVFDL